MIPETNVKIDKPLKIRSIDNKIEYRRIEDRIEALKDINRRTENKEQKYIK